MIRLANSIEKTAAYVSTGVLNVYRAFHVCNKPPTVNKTIILFLSPSLSISYYLLSCYAILMSEIIQKWL